MASTATTSNTTNSSTSEDSTVTYLFLASRLYPFGNSSSVKTDENGQLVKSDEQQIISLDVTTRFSTDWQGELTRYPVSSGSDITEHLTIRNNRYTLEGVISDVPFESYSDEFFSDYKTGSRRAMAAVEKLEQMYQDKVVFTLFSEYQQIDNCIMTSISFDQTSEYAVKFSIQMEKLRFAYAKTVTLNVSSGTKKKTASNQNGGGTTKSQTDANAYRKNRDEAISKNNASGT